MKIPTNFLMSEYEFEQLLKQYYKKGEISYNDISIAITEIQTYIAENNKKSMLCAENFKYGNESGLSSIATQIEISRQNLRYERWLKVLNKYLKELSKTKNTTGVVL